MKRNENSIVWQELSDPAELANALAHALHTQCLLLLSEQSKLLIGLAGGSTPMAAYAEWAEAQLPWSNIELTLIDERFVPLSDSQSNEHHIAKAFSAIQKQLAGWHGLYHDVENIEQCAALANQELQVLNHAMDIVVIGMGADGHIASLFIESADYISAMDTHNTEVVLPIRFNQPQKIDRLSFSLAELLKAKKAMICITGDEKRAVIEQSMRDSQSPYAMTQFLNAYQNPVEIFWSPA
ncbi:MAG: 6-phosphogluconolactonase [Arenimonas sp.]|nr:6-phosphogluconolactonase [Arenimonas sp.]